MRKEKKYFAYDYYNLYLYNLHTIINIYGYKYRWVNLSKERFFNHSGHSFTNFSVDDKFLQKYAEDKIQLGKAILREGTYTPFFCFRDSNDYNMIMLGKHRLYSLLKCQLQEPLGRDFLFVEYPHDPLNDKEVHKKNISPTAPLYFFDKTWGNLELRYPDCEHMINLVLLCTGDSLSDFFFEEKTQPSLYINSPENFDSFLKNPFVPNVTLRERE